MIVGAGEKFTGALIVPAFNVLKEKIGNSINGLGKEEIIQQQVVKEVFTSVVEDMNNNFSQVEKIKKFELLPNEWTIEGGELTPTLKLKRKVIMEKYSDAVYRIYHESAG